jgi:hypothetical protein
MNSQVTLRTLLAGAGAAAAAATIGRLAGTSSAQGDGSGALIRALPTATRPAACVRSQEMSEHRQA